VAEQPTYEFVEVKADDILAERQKLWAGFTQFLTWTTAAVAVALLLLYVIWG
jgi:hypothetical protein